MDLQSVQNFLGTTVADLAIKVLAAIAFWIVGRWLIGRVIAIMSAAMNRNHIDPTLTKYLGSIVNVALNIALVLGILGYFGIQTTSFAAMLAGAGVAIGVAWSGMLGNFAAGAFMLVLRPIKVGDFVQVGGLVGTVHELGLFATTIITPDNVFTLVGNSKIFGDTIQNFSARPVRRVERTAQLAGSVDPLDAIARFKAAVAKIPNVATDPAPEVNLLDINLVGTVHELGLFATTIITPDNVFTLVSNSKIFGDTIQNFSARPVRRVERTAQLAGSVDALDAIARFKAAVAQIPNVATDPAPEVNLLDINLVGTVIAVRPYCHTDHYWQVYFDTNEAIVRVCKEAGWPAPTPTQIMKTMAA